MRARVSGDESRVPFPDPADTPALRTGLEAVEEGAAHVIGTLSRQGVEARVTAALGDQRPVIESRIALGKAP